MMEKDNKEFEKLLEEYEECLFECYVNKRDDYTFVNGMLECRNKILAMYRGEKI